MVKINNQIEGYNVSTQYGFLLYEAVAKTIGIDMISKEILENTDPKDIIRIQLGIYLHYLFKVVDENEGRKARTTLKEDIILEEESLRQALSIDFNEETAERLLKNIKLIYGINAITSTVENTLYDWDLVIDRKKNKVLGFLLKNNNNNLCNLNYQEEIIEKGYEYLNTNDKLFPEYIDEMGQRENQESSIYESTDRLLEAYDKNPDFFQECIGKVTSIDPQEIISMVKGKIPDAYNWWFCTTVNMNKEYISNKIKRKPYRH